MTRTTPRTRAAATAAAAVLAAQALAVATAAPAAADDHRPRRADAQQTFYVDCSRNTNGTGTQARPWNVLSAVAARTFAPGDRILLKRGTACRGVLSPQGSGAAGAPIVVDAYGTGAKPRVDGGGAPAAVYLFNQQHWEIRNLEVTNQGATVANRRGVHIRLHDHGTGTHYRLVNLTVHDVNGDNTKDVGGSSGIHLDVKGGSVPTRFDDVVIDGNEVYSVDRSGINMSSDWWCRAEVNCASGLPYTPWSRFTVQNNTVHDIGGDGIVMQYTEGGLNQYNTAYDTNMRSGLNNAGIWAWNADHVTFQFNEAYRVRRPAGTADGNAFDADYGTDGTLFQYNYSHDNEGGFLLYCGCGGGTASTKNAVARYNVSQNDGSRIIAAAGVTGGQFYNNTIYLKPGSTTHIVEELWPEGTSHLTLANNIFVNQGSGGYVIPVASRANYTWTHNLFYGNHPADEPADPHKITADPLFTAPGTGPYGYPLKTGSPALGAGTPIADNGGRDYAGNPVPVSCAPDLGAFQSSSC